jgi:hypothetical protein
MGLLQLYSRHRMIDMAINLSRRLREEQLKTPEFYELLGELIESQYSRNATSSQAVEQQQQQQVPMGPPGLLLQLPQPLEQQPFLQAFQYNPYLNQYMAVAPAAAAAPTMPPPPVPCGLFTSPDPPSQYQYYYPVPLPQQQPPPIAALYPTPPQSEISASPPLCGYPPAPETPDLMSIASSDAPSSASTLMSLPGGPPLLNLGGGMGADGLMEFYLPQPQELLQPQHAEPGFLHRQLKRAVSNGDAAEGLAMYLALERAGKVVNVTESSSLIEQLVRVDMTHEATQLTQGMLLRNTHPLPKIFR